MRIVTVGELTQYLKAMLADDYHLHDLWVQGEITNYSQSGAGHRYFSLKDAEGMLRCVLFAGRGGTLPPLRNGVAVLAHGHMSLYEARGELQLYVDEVQDAGVGILNLRFEQLKERLEAEGLFAPERKRPVPRCPDVIGVVTSPAAAALRDIVRTLRLRCPLARVILAPAQVQGEGSAKQVAAAIAALNAHAEAQVIIVARGGGSLEELWAFNEEVVARAIAASRVPVISGVGHETDFTIADFVADLRASTPTAAATAAVPDTTTWSDSLLQARGRLEQSTRAYIQARHDLLAHRVHALDQASPRQRLGDAHARTQAAAAALANGVRHQLILRQEQLRSRALQLQALSPLQTLARGFAVVRRQPDGMLVTSIAHVAAGQGLAIQVADGSFAATAGPRLVAHAPDARPGKMAPPPAARQHATVASRADVSSSGESEVRDAE